MASQTILFPVKRLANQQRVLMYPRRDRN